MSLRRGIANVLAASATAMLMLGVPAVAGSPFSALVGTWSGKGTARLEGGKSETALVQGLLLGLGRLRAQAQHHLRQSLDQGRAALGAEVRRRPRLRHLGRAELQSDTERSPAAPTDDKLQLDDRAATA